MITEPSEKDIKFTRTNVKSFPAWVEIRSLFWLVLAVNNFTAFIAFAHQFGNLSLRFVVFELIGVLSYVLAAALLESLTVMFGLVLLSVALPQKWFRQKFSHFGALWYLIITLFLYPIIGFTSLRSMNEFFVPISELPVDERVLFIGVWVVTIPALFFLFRRIMIRNSPKVTALLDRLSVLSFIYFVADFLALISITFRQFLL